MKKNNVDLAAASALAERARTDPAAVRMLKRVEGAWSLRDGSPQFSANLAHGDGGSLLLADMAPAFGGGGRAPDPLQYLLFGLASCYTATLVMIASAEGVDLGEVRTSAEAAVDVSRTLGLADRPLVERISVRVAVTAPVDDARLADWAKRAREGCPFAFTVAHPIPLETVVARG
ncbi:MAG TPA: OsmC family protein [Anaeromyxobacteraceae bacterium]|nr:OsmC family protein [Anaeromyxobacteraceae bacterium]